MITMTNFALKAAFPVLLPLAIEWAESAATDVANSGKPLSETEQAIARRVGVQRPHLIRIAIVDEMPRPSHPMLQTAASAAGFLGPGTAGLTLGHSVLVRRGHESARLFSHEFRHVFQYEQAGSIADFLPVYLRQILEAGYFDAPFEIDARNHEIEG